MMRLNATQSAMIESLTEILSMVSVFVSVVLGFLIIFANNFLIRRRKKELGIYMTLGMSKYSISRIIVVETVFVGLVSLIVGLLLGIIFSQGLSVLTAKMFEVNITNYSFVFSSEAMLKTILYFGIIFFLVMVFNSIIISRYKLIDLITAAKKNETLKVRKTSTSIIIFILSIIILGISYTVILKNGLLKDMNIVWGCVALGSLGTFLFFMSLSGFALNMIQKNKKIYFKEVNMFILRQINSKVNTTFISMTVICIMLFFTIGVLSTGFSYKTMANETLRNTTPYDATFTLNVDENSKITNVKEIVKQEGLDLDQMGEAHSFYLYDTGLSIPNLLTPYLEKDVENVFKGFGALSLRLVALTQSDYNALAKMQDQDPIHLQDDEVAYMTNMKELKGSILKLVEGKKTINLAKKTFHVNSEVREFTYMTDYMARDFLTVVVPNQVISKMPIQSSMANLMYTGNKKDNDDKIDKFMMSSMKEGKEIEFYGLTKKMIYDVSVGNSTIIVFLGIYLGIIFLISSAAVLALQQLSEASDNKERYIMLRKIGVTKKVVNKAIFRQILIYFMMPLLLAIVHSIFGIQVVNQILVQQGKASVILPATFTSIVMIVVYGGYFLATYTGYKNIVK